MRFYLKYKRFSLPDCLNGKPCCTVSGYTARFIFMCNGPAPVVMIIGESEMENYTTDGNHLFDPRLNLQMEESVHVNTPEKPMAPYSPPPPKKQRIKTKK